MNPRLLTILLLGITVVWGWTFVVVQEAIVRYGVLPFLAVRFAIGAAVLAALAARRSTRRTWLCGGLIGLVLAAGYMTQTIGLKYTTASNSGLITGLFVVFVPLVNRALFKVRIGPVLWAAIVASAVGLGLLTGQSVTPWSAGDLLTLVCAVLFAVQIVLLDRHAKGHDGLALAMAQITAAAVVFSGTWIVIEPLAWPGRNVWFALLVTGVIATAAGFCVQAYAQQKLPAVRAAVIMSTEPVFAMLFGYWLAGDRLTPLQLVGAVVMISAVVAAELAESWKAAPRHP
ncbi:MAG: DMT family transporter [Pirellulales bacterium]|nr:DMT family transporter [Pirellulales bacterium]